MTGFLRPEVLAFLTRWREALLGLLLAVLGLYWALTAFGSLRYVGMVLGLAGAVLVREGVRRARLPAGGGGVGLVEVDERQITYFGPRGGGTVSLDSLNRVEIVTTADGPLASDLFWCLHGDDGPPLMIPHDAEGAAALYDALTALPGVDFEQVIAAMGSTEPNRFAVWRRARRALT